MFRNTFTALFVFSAASFAQMLGPVSIGVKAGIPLTDAFYNTTLSPGQSLYSNSQNYILGPSVEMRLPFRTSVEFDALYRPLTFGTTTASVINGSAVLSRTSTTLSTWEFPLLFKHHFVGHDSERWIKPYVEVGPSFRSTASQLNYLSGKGVTAGLGADFKPVLVRLSPEFRYTHWTADGVQSIGEAPLASRKDQVEFLLGVSF
jgi:hypothetical protein